MKKYLKTLHKVINEDISVNLLIVNNADAFTAAEKIDLSPQELRNLFYIKIPERLFYGVTRNLSHLESKEKVNVQIVIDENDEYDKIDLNNKIIEQMNAHSAYRNKNYRIANVNTKNSEDSIPLQIIDTFMGIVVFLLEKTYLEKSDASKIKSDLIYRLLSEQDNLVRFQKQIKLFKWTGSEELELINIAEYLSPFMVYQTEHDIQQMLKIQELEFANPGINTKELRILAGFPNTMLRTFLGYRDEISGKGRNTFILK
ncbi:DUF3800 domain-containing protein [Rossellomorea marisflavi]|uniref:DUF3800 domain-containing protein n=1 Tax=Rossellomorea marisflavi TaxID=189381 RepID=UPI003D2ECCF0